MTGSRKREGALRAFFRLEAASGIALLGGAILALAWANSPWASAYNGLKHASELAVNDLLMAVFFLMMGLEIRREMSSGELSSRRQAALPLAGALGGMLVPALLFLAWNHGGPAAHAWGVPMATDIAFALGVMTLLGRRVPLGLKIILVALAIIDDLGAILVIALFYSGNLQVAWLGGAAAIAAGLRFLNRQGVTHPLAWLAGAIGLWLALWHSGVHATLAGVVLAFCVPRSTIERLETILHPWVNFGILPLFALVNAGIALTPGVWGALHEPVGLGIMTGLLVGKPLGILAFAWLAVRFGLATLPAATGWGLMAGAGLLGGIGFTMSLFIADLGLSPELLDGAKFSVLAASAIAGLCGYLVLRLLARRAKVA